MFSTRTIRPSLVLPRHRGGYFITELTVVVLALAAMVGVAIFAVPHFTPAADTGIHDVRPVRSLTSVGSEGRFVAMLTDTECLLHDLASEQLMPLWLKVDNDWVSTIAGSPVAPRLLICKSSQEATLIDITTGETVWSVDTRSALSLSAYFSSDGSAIALGTERGELLVLDAATGSERLRLRGTVDVAAVAFSHDGRHVIAADSTDSVSVWDCDSGRLVQQFVEPGIHVNAIACSSDGDSVALATSSGATIVFSQSTGREIARFNDSTLQTLAVDFTADGRRLVRGTTWGTIHETDATTGSGLEWNAHKAAVRDLLFIGDSLISAGHDGQVLRWNADRTQFRELLQRSN